MRGIRSGVTRVFMWVYILKVMFCRLRKVRKPLLCLSSETKQVCFLKFRCFSPSEMCEAMARTCESYRRDVLSHSLTDIDDETLRGQLEKRGYNVTKRRETETTAEIVKIR